MGEELAIAGYLSFCKETNECPVLAGKEWDIIVAALRRTPSHGQPAPVAEVTDFRWLIEAPGQRYLACRRLGCDEFFWTADHNEALAFRCEKQADGAMMAIRQMDRTINGFDKGLFAFEVTIGDAKAVEHGWLAALSRPVEAGETQHSTQSLRGKSRE